MNEKTKFIIGIIIITGITLFFLMIHTRPYESTLPEQSDKLSEIINRGTLVIATDPESPPLSEIIPGSDRNSSTRCEPAEYSCDELRGFDIAVGKEIAERLGVEPCFVTPAWTRIVCGDWGDSWDISVGSMTITSERMNYLHFTDPYNSAPALVFVRQNDEQYQQPEDLSGRRIGVCAGCAQEQYLKGTLKLPGTDIRYSISNATPVAYNYESLAQDDLISESANSIDAVILDAPIGMQSIESGMPLRPLMEPLYYSYFAAAIDKKSSTNPVPFITKVSEIIRKMHDDGTLHTLAGQYLIQDYTKEAKLFNITSLRQYN